MATRTIFIGKNNNEMDCLVNDSQELYIGIHEAGEEYNGVQYITLDKEDVEVLIGVLKEAQEEMR